MVRRLAKSRRRRRRQRKIVELRRIVLRLAHEIAETDLAAHTAARRARKRARKASRKAKAKVKAEEKLEGCVAMTALLGGLSLSDLEGETEMSGVENQGA